MSARLVISPEGTSVEFPEDALHQHQNNQSSRLFPIAVREKMQGIFQGNPKVTPMQMREALYRYGLVIRDSDHQLLRSNIKTMRKHYNRQCLEHDRFALEDVQSLPTKTSVFRRRGPTNSLDELPSRSASSNRVESISEWCIQNSLTRYIEEMNNVDQFTTGVIGLSFSSCGECFIALACVHSLSNFYRQERQGRLVLEADAT
ncbi:MAG: hypothetical protein AAGM67_07620, partial [Bacteroidota bacterium]